MTRRRAATFAGAASVLVAFAAGGLWAGLRADGETERQRDVAGRGAQVMRFDLERTTHVFEKRRGGGVQTVVADDADDATEVANVRTHLSREAQAFAAGRYDDPAAIHGMEMPGLAELQAGAARMRVSYEEVPGGGRIRYASDDEALARALHAWFDAQVSDHGRHAEEIE